MLNTIAPFWDGNQTWLVVIGASLFAAFPVVYAVFLGAFYIPVLLLLFGLIFRGIAFEFRGRSKRLLPLWDSGFFVGSDRGRLRAGRRHRCHDEGDSGRQRAVRGPYVRLGAPVPDLHRHRHGARIRLARRVLAGPEERRGAP